MTAKRPALHREAPRILEELTKDETLFFLGWGGLLRHLLADYFEGRVFEADEKQLRKVAATVLGTSLGELPEGEEELAKHVLAECAQVGRLPRDVFIELQRAACNDLSDVRANVEACDERLAELERRRAAGNEEDGDHYEVRYLHFKKQQNLGAREEITTFLESGVDAEVMFQARKPLLIKWFSSMLFMFRAPYHFRRVPHVYSPTSLSEVRNKFGDEPILVVQEWEELFEDDRAAFHTKAGEYIRSRKVTDRIRDGLHAHHRLAARAAILEAALEAHEEQHFAVFCNLAPIQVEGLLGDYAAEIGVPHGSLRFAPLAAKLDHIRATDRVFGDFEYFRFRFPVIRNQVAHGRFEVDNEEEVANLLLLDLADLCRRLQDDDLPANELVDLLRNGQPSEPKDVLRFARRRDVELPTFYGLASEYGRFEMALSSMAFWDWLEQRVDEAVLHDDDVLKELRSVMIELKKAGLDRGRASSLLRKVPGRDPVQNA